MDISQKWKSRWINPKAKAFHSEIHGTGVIAIEPIFKGEIVGVLGGIVVPAGDIEEYRKTMTHVGIQINDQFFLCPSKRDDLEDTGVFNHSCEPNVGILDSIIFIAIKDIKKEEELVIDYAFMETLFEPFECICGSVNCRKKITPSDWKLPELQKKYGEYFSTYIKKKFKQKC
jgi:uncharacterized protein